MADPHTRLRVSRRLPQRNGCLMHRWSRQIIRKSHQSDRPGITLSHTLNCCRSREEVIHFDQTLATGRHGFRTSRAVTINTYDSCITVFPQLPRVSAMTPKPQRKKGRDGVSTIDAAIQDLNLAKDTCSIQPVQDAFSSVSNLLTTTGVRSFASCGDKFPVHVYPGHQSQRTGLRRPWAVLRRDL